MESAPVLISYRSERYNRYKSGTDTVVQIGTDVVQIGTDTVVQIGTDVVQIKSVYLYQ